MKERPRLDEAHDNCVRVIADELRRDKWAVKANVEGYEKPSEVHGHRPDIEAKKDCLTRICEVATDETLEADKEELADLRSYCENYDFHLYLLGKDGKRRKIGQESFEKK